jgi:hypothetical protein
MCAARDELTGPLDFLLWKGVFYGDCSSPTSSLKLNELIINIAHDMESLDTRMLPRFRNSIRYRADLH